MTLTTIFLGHPVRGFGIKQGRNVSVCLYLRIYFMPRIVLFLQKLVGIYHAGQEICRSCYELIFVCFLFLGGEVSCNKAESEMGNILLLCSLCFQFILFEIACFFILSILFIYSYISIVEFHQEAARLRGIFPAQQDNGTVPFHLLSGRFKAGQSQVWCLEKS